MEFIETEPLHEPVVHAPKIEPQGYLKQVENNPSNAPGDDELQLVYGVQLHECIGSYFEADVNKKGEGADFAEENPVLDSLEDPLERLIDLRHLSLHNHQLEAEEQVPEQVHYQKRVYHLARVVEVIHEPVTSLLNCKVPGGSQDYYCQQHA